MSDREQGFDRGKICPVNELLRRAAAYPDNAAAIRQISREGASPSTDSPNRCRAQSRRGSGRSQALPAPSE